MGRHRSDSGAAGPLTPAMFHILLALAGDERRRYYRLSDRGRRAAGAEARRLETLVRAARGRHLLGQPIPGSQGGAS